MRITPLDVRKQEFNKTMRGFDCDEVRAFLSTLADEYETVLVDNKQIRELIMEQEDKINEYRGMERNLRDTLMTAERVMQDTRENANKKGDLIIKDAEMKAKGVLEECRLRTEELRREIVGLRKEKESYLARFKTLAQAQIQFVESHQNDFEDLDKRLTNIVDSVVATATHTRRKTDPKPDFSNPETPVIDPFAAENRIEGDPSAPRDQQPAGQDVPAGAKEELEVTPPAAPMEEDIWRNYNPGEKNKEEADKNGAISDLVAESLAETGSDASSEKAGPPEANLDSPDESSLGDGPVMTDGSEPVSAGATKDNG
jgi:cell division initiation protein